VLQERNKRQALQGVSEERRVYTITYIFGPMDRQLERFEPGPWSQGRP
jgi:hypothetical protein